MKLSMILPRDKKNNKRKSDLDFLVYERNKMY